MARASMTPWRMSPSRCFAFLLLVLAGAACSRQAEPPPAETSAAPAVAAVPAALRVEALATPSAAGSAQPGLAVDSQGRALLSWLEPVATGGRALRFSTWDVDHWSEARTIVQGEDLLANWADT